MHSDVSICRWPCRPCRGRTWTKKSLSPNRLWRSPQGHLYMNIFKLLAASSSCMQRQVNSCTKEHLHNMSWWWNQEFEHVWAHIFAYTLDTCLKQRTQCYCIASIFTSQPSLHRFLILANFPPFTDSDQTSGASVEELGEPSAFIGVSNPKKNHVSSSFNIQGPGSWADLPH